MAAADEGFSMFLLRLCFFSTCCCCCYCNPVKQQLVSQLSIRRTLQGCQTHTHTHTRCPVIQMFNYLYSNHQRQPLGFLFWNVK